MENVVLIIHLILALGLIGVVLLQRSEGGGLGIGGGGGGTSGRPPATPMSKVTWLLGIAFVITSVTLTIVSAQRSAGVSVIDRLTASPPALNQLDDGPVAPDADNLLPPAQGDNAPLVPTLD